MERYENIENLQENFSRAFYSNETGTLESQTRHAFEILKSRLASSILVTSSTDERTSSP